MSPMINIHSRQEEGGEEKKEKHFDTVCLFLSQKNWAHAYFISLLFPIVSFSNMCVVLCCEGKKGSYRESTHLFMDLLCVLKLFQSS